MANTISTVGSLAQTNSTGGLTLSVTPSTVGDLFVVWANTEFSSGGTSKVASLSGGGVTTWNQISTAANMQSGYNATLWYGVITTAGSSTITFTGSGSLSSYGCIYAAQEFTTGGGSQTTWAIDGTQVGEQTFTTGTSVAFPTLTPGGSNRLYAGNVMATGTVSGGTSGYTLTSLNTYTNNGTFWNTSVSTAQSPTCTQSVSGKYGTVAGLITGTNAVTVPSAPLNRARLIRASYW